jgi:uncharacterized protein YdaU (DUF1376 family)
VKVKFVQLESAAFLTDLDFIAMTPAERGVYCSLIFYMYSNGGKCNLETELLRKLCGCESCEEFEIIFSNISKKFQECSGIIKHKRVTKELKRAKKFIQHQRKAGLASARKRKQQLNHGSDDAGHSVQPTKSKRNVNEKERKNNSITNTKERSLSFTSSVRPRTLMFHEALINIIGARSQSDRTCFRNVTRWLIEGIASGRFNEKIFDRVLDYAKEARNGRRPAAVFMALMKRELKYQPQASKGL